MSPSPAAPTDQAEIAARLLLSSTRLARRLRQEASTGLTPSLLSALAAVERHGPLTLGALAEHERVAPPSITKVVAKLEAEELLERAVDPSDRRVARVAVTKVGQELLEESRRRKTSWLLDRIRALPVDEQDLLAAALDAIDHLIAPPQGPT